MQHSPYMNPKIHTGSLDVTISIATIGSDAESTDIFQIFTFRTKIVLWTAAYGTPRQVYTGILSVQGRNCRCSVVDKFSHSLVRQRRGKSEG